MKKEEVVSYSYASLGFWPDSRLKTKVIIACLLWCRTPPMFCSQSWAFAWYFPRVARVFFRWLWSLKVSQTFTRLLPFPRLRCNHLHTWPRTRSRIPPVVLATCLNISGEASSSGHCVITPIWRCGDSENKERVVFAKWTISLIEDKCLVLLAHRRQLRTQKNKCSWTSPCQRHHWTKSTAFGPMANDICGSEHAIGGSSVLIGY
jgi:hypothetical protein